LASSSSAAVSSEEVDELHIALEEIPCMDTKPLIKDDRAHNAYVAVFVGGRGGGAGRADACFLPMMTCSVVMPTTPYPRRLAPARFPRCRALLCTSNAMPWAVPRS
jgi:hypothetical protein